MSVLIRLLPARAWTHGALFSYYQFHAVRHHSPTSYRSRSLSFVEAETNHYPGLFFKPANVSHFLWEAEMAEFKQCNYSQMSDMVNVHG